MSPVRNKPGTDGTFTIHFHSVGSTNAGAPPSFFEGWDSSRPYPRTLTLENDSTARDEIGCPIDIAGRNVVKISIRFTCGRSS